MNRTGKTGLAACRMTDDGNLFGVVDKNLGLAAEQQHYEPIPVLMYRTLVVQRHSQFAFSRGERGGGRFS